MTLPGLVAAQNLADVVDREKAWDNLGSSVSANFSISSPSLDLNFAANKSLVDDISGNNLITFSRASTGTFVGSNGLLQTAASGVPRFDHNPTTKESLGLLVEEAKTNSQTYSEQFDNAVWYKLGTTVTANATTAPDGTLTADKLVNDSSTGQHLIAGAQVIFAPLTSGATFSCFVKAGELTKAALGYVNVYVVFNLATGTVFSTTNAYGWTLTSSIQSLPNGWYRCVITYNTNGSAFNPGLTVYAADSSGNISYTGNGTSGIYLWGAQLELGAFPTSYIPTTSATVTRAADVATITGANFLSWYNNAQGSFYGEWRIPTLNKNNVATAAGFGANGNNGFLNYPFGTNSVPKVKQAIGLTNFSVGNAASPVNQISAVNGAIGGAGPNIVSPTYPNDLLIGYQTGNPNYLNGTIARLAYYPVRLADLALQYITSASGSPSSTTYPYTFTIKGKDTLALNSVSNASARSFVFIKGLTSAAQPRITTAAQQAASGTALRDLALLRNAPSSVGDYYASRGVFDAGTLKINGIQAASLSSSPFSGSTALFPISIRTMELSSNFRLATTFSSGTIAFPERAIPVDTTSLILYAKAGQN